MKPKKPNRLPSFVVLPSLLFGLIPILSAQGLAPDDPAISGNLQLWLRDAAGTFDEGTGIWADSSGQGNDAETIGEINVTGLQTWLAPTLGTTSGGGLSNDDLPAVHFAADVNDLMGTPGLNGNLGMANLTIFAIYNITNLGGNPNLTRPLGIGSISATQTNPGDHVNLSTDPSVRKDNGNVGAGQYSQPFPTGSLLIRSTRLNPSSIDEWFNTDGTPTKVLSIAGVSYTTSVDRFYLGDLRGGNDTVPGFGVATARSDFDIVQVLFYNSALSDDQIAGVNEWLANNLVPQNRLALTDVSRDDATGEFTISWESAHGELYNLRSETDPSSDPGIWPIFEDKMDIPATPPVNTLSVPYSADPKRFFVVESFPVPPTSVYSEDFEGGAAGWTTGVDPADTDMNTAWELGTPSNAVFGGPPTAQSGTTCYGTNLTANYGISSNTWLRSPAIDLSAATASATVTFQQWVDMDAFDNLDRGTVRVLDAVGLPGTVTELGVVQADITGLGALDWVAFSADLPAAALGQSIVLEFIFESDPDDFADASGWYVDDLEVTVR